MAASRPYRVARMREMLTAFAPLEAGFGFHGLASAQMFAELRLAYMHGLYLSTVLLVLGCLEHELAGALYAAGWDKAASARLEALVAESERRGFITVAEAAAFNRLRATRNAHAHFRAPGSRSTLMRRMVDDDQEPHALLQSDARLAIGVLGSYLARR